MKKLTMFILGIALLFAVGLTAQVLTAEVISAQEGLPDGNETYKRPSCESSSGVRGCGDRQETDCSFGKKVDC